MNHTDTLPVDAEALAAEAVERAALEDLFAAAPPSLGARGLTLGSAFAGVAPGLPASAIVLNRAIGLGVAAPAADDEIARLRAAYDAAGFARWFLHLHPAARLATPDAPRSSQATLAAAAAGAGAVAGAVTVGDASRLQAQARTVGLQPVRSWQKFMRDLAPPAAVPTSLSVREVGPDQGPAFARIVCAGFDLGDAAWPWLAALPGRPGWSVFMSFDGETPAGTGALFVRDGVGWLDWASTDPACRRRGGQAALLAARIAHARRLGCRRLFTCTGEEVPGDPQHSFHNILRAGFAPTTLRANWAPRR